MSIRSNVDRTALNERIRIERKTVAQNPTTGSMTPTWSLLVTCYARVDGVKASDRWKEPLEAGATLQITDDTFWVRADIVQRFSLVEGDRIIWKGKVYNIRDIPDQQLRGRLTPLIAHAGASHG